MVLGAVSRTKHSFQTIWTSHLFTPKKETECPKEFCLKKSQKNGWSAIIRLIFIFFFVFIIFLRIIIIIILIIVLSPLTWFAGDSALVFIHLDCWDQICTPQSDVPERTAETRVCQANYPQPLPSWTRCTKTCWGGEENCVLFMCVLRDF